MKILSICLILSAPLLGQPAPPGAAPPPGTPAGGYKPTIYNKDYSKGFIGPDAKPDEELEAMYPQATYTMKNQNNPTGDSTDNSTSPDFTAARSQAVYWLGLLDQGAYPSSWSQASGLLQDILSQNIWTAAMKAVRGNYGNSTSRKVTSHRLMNKLPHGTQGKFMEITFESSFSSKGKVQETVTLMAIGERGQWKVATYSLGS